LFSKSPLPSIYSQPEHGRRLALATFPLVNDRLAGRPDFVGELLLAEPKAGP
jgi:hypothetical protein